MNIYCLRDTCVQTCLMPVYFPNHAAAVRAVGDAVNKPSEDNLHTHPEHYHLLYIGSFDEDTGVITAQAPDFVVDLQSLVR